MILLARLTIKQKRFADEYIISGNAADAARKAGYKQPRAIGHENLTKPNIQKYIKTRLEKIESEKTMSLEEAIQRTSSIARREIQQGYSKQVDVTTGEVVKEVKYIFTPTIEEAQKSLEHIIRCGGGFIDKKEQEARIKRLEAETERIIEETARKSGKKGIDEAENQVSAIAELINNPDSERVLSDFMGGAEDDSNTDESNSI